MPGMAVFTDVTLDDATALAAHLHLGAVQELRGIPAGIENTNYFLTTRRGAWVLTLFERLDASQLPFYLHLMKHLAQRGIPVPEPQADEAGALLHRLAGKPAAVVTRLDGAHALAPDLTQCAQVGAMLARMHLAGLDFPRVQPNLRGLPWWQATAPQVLPFLGAAQRALLEQELAFQAQLAASPAHAALPRGPIHADLFRDNVMFVGARLSGFFDFYFAGVDAWLYDLATCLNDWAIDEASGRLDEARALAFVQAYSAVRELGGDEQRLLPAMMRAAALRFWISRLWDWHLPRDARLLAPKDPAHFERVLRARIDEPWHPTP
jgi:homoserine kinase type II